MAGHTRGGAHARPGCSACTVTLVQRLRLAQFRRYPDPASAPAGHKSGGNGSGGPQIEWQQLRGSRIHWWRLRRVINLTAVASGAPDSGADALAGPKFSGGVSGGHQTRRRLLPSPSKRARQIRWSATGSGERRQYTRGPDKRRRDMVYVEGKRGLINKTEEREELGI